MTTQPAFTRKQIAGILAKPGPARDALAIEGVGYPLAPGYRLDYHRGRFEEKWLRQGGFPRLVFGEWMLYFPVGKGSESRRSIGLADAKPNPHRYGGLSFAQALVKARVWRAEVEALPKSTLGDTGRAYVKHVRASGNPVGAEAEADLRTFFQVVGIADGYFAMFPHMRGHTWRVALLNHIAGSAYANLALEERPRVRAIVNRIFRHFVAACEHRYAAGKSGLKLTPWRRFKPLKDRP